MSLGIQSRIDARLEAVNIKWGYGNCRTITYVADSSGSLNDTYHDLNAIDANGDEKLYYVWYNINSAGTDPVISGKTGIEVTEATNATAEEIRDASNAAIAAAVYEGFLKDSSTDALIVENWYPGEITAETDSGSTGFTFVTDRDGFGGDLGATLEGSTLALEPQTTEIQANQFGGLKLDEIQQGIVASINAPLTEVTAETIDRVFSKVMGDKVTDGLTDVIGVGESKLFNSLSSAGGRLILHPIRLDNDDRSADWIFWNSAPKPQDLNFDGTSQQVLNVQFDAYLDANIDTKINLAAYGDWTQQEVLA